jgi:hypothetical protein
MIRRDMHAVGCARFELPLSSSEARRRLGTDPHVGRRVEKVLQGVKREIRAMCTPCGPHVCKWGIQVVSAALLRRTYAILHSVELCNEPSDEGCRERRSRT